MKNGRLLKNNDYTRKKLYKSVNDKEKDNFEDFKKKNLTSVVNTCYTTGMNNRLRTLFALVVNRLRGCVVE